MLEYLHLGSMEVILKNEYEKPNAYYLLHHTVLRDSSSTTKLRASSKSTSRQFSNNLLMVGPRVLTELYPILMHFCTFSSGCLRWCCQNVLTNLNSRGWYWLATHSSEELTWRCYWRMLSINSYIWNCKCSIPFNKNFEATCSRWKRNFPFCSRSNASSFLCRWFIEQNWYKRRCNRTCNGVEWNDEKGRFSPPENGSQMIPLSFVTYLMIPTKTNHFTLLTMTVVYLESNSLSN